MQDRPDKDVLLDALAAFLAREVLPATTDRGLSFRVRIAAHLLGGLAREVRGEEAHDEAHLRTLLELLDGDRDIPALASARRDAIRSAEAALADRIRTTGASEVEDQRLRTALRGVLATRISVGNPRFDLSDDIEES